MERLSYSVPQIEVLEVEIEQGFATSQERELPGFGNGGHLGDDFGEEFY